MKRLFASALASFALFTTGQAAWKMVDNDDPSVTCTKKSGQGRNACCCYQSTCGAWELPCQGDLAQTCTADQLVGPYGQGDGFNYTEVKVGSCPGPPACDQTRWNYTWSCCDKPVMGNWIAYHSDGEQNSYCPMAPFFIGCTLPNEALSSDNQSCSNTTCPTLHPVTASTYLSGNQPVIASGFQAAMTSLTTCAKQLGAKTKLNVQNTSQCGKSASVNATSGTSANQVGMALDTNLVLPDGTACDRNCMAQGYCAYRQGSSACANSTNCVGCAGQPQNQRNQWINQFFTCAAKVSGLRLGAAFVPANWNHFEIPVTNITTALRNYTPQLKAFCMGLCPSSKKKGTVGSTMCQCPGF